MKLTLSLIAFVSLFSLVSCGPSAEERAAIEKLKADSIAAATEQALLDKMEMQQFLQDSLVIATTDRETLEIILTNAKGDLAVAEDKMAQIKEWQLGRAPSEREQQIKDQTIVIDDLTKYVESITEEIAKVDEKIADIELELKNYE